MSEARDKLTAPIRMAEGVLCAECEYNLKGLSSEGVCPECNYPIAASVERARLAVPPKWLGVAERVYLIATVCSVVTMIGLLFGLIPDRGSVLLVAGAFLPLIGVGIALSSIHAKYTKKWTTSGIVVVIQLAMVLLVMLPGFIVVLLFG